MQPAPVELQRVPFYGEDFLEATRTEDGTIWVSVKRACESLGLSDLPQKRKLRSSAWARDTIMVSLDTKGARQKTYMIDLDSLPMWLTTIHPAKVAFETRSKLEAFQREAKSVLSAWFLGPASSHAELAREFAETRKRLELDRDVERARAGMLEGIADDAVEENELLLKPFRAVEGESHYFTLRQFCDQYEVLDACGHRLKGGALSSVGRRLKTASEALRVPVMSTEHAFLGRVNLYRLDILANWRMNHDIECRTRAGTLGRIIVHGI